MASDWEKIKDLAVWLKNCADKAGDKKEHFQRCAFSRYYYSAFHKARNWAENQSPKLTRQKPAGYPGGTHDRLWGYLKSKTSIDAFDVRGNGAHRRRCNADYELLGERGLDFDAETFEDSWNKVERLHRLIDALPKPQWPDKADEIMAYQGHLNSIVALIEEEEKREAEEEEAESGEST